MKQSGRTFLHELKSLTMFDQVFHHGVDLKLIAHEKLDTGRTIEGQSAAQSLLVLIEPEGGFSEEELELAARHDCVPISLGPRRLRSQTAAIVSVSRCVFRR